MHPTLTQPDRARTGGLHVIGAGEARGARDEVHQRGRRPGRQGRGRALAGARLRIAPPPPRHQPRAIFQPAVLEGASCLACAGSADAAMSARMPKVTALLDSP